MTNADRIRSMTDVELAFYLVENCECSLKKICDCDCVECWVSWLQDKFPGEGRVNISSDDVSDAVSG